MADPTSCSESARSSLSGIGDPWYESSEGTVMEILNHHAPLPLNGESQSVANIRP